LWGLLGRMAPREVVNAVSRTSIAVAALMVALAVTIGVSLMVTSFRSTVTTWMNQILHGDIYISAPSATVNQPSLPLQADALQLLSEWPGVDRIDLLQTALVESPYGPIQVSANNNPNDGLEQLYAASDYPPEEIWPALSNGAILVSEPLANRLGLPQHNGVLNLYTASGIHTFPIAGIFYDYSSIQGSVIMALDVYRQFWQDDQVSAAAVILNPSVDPESTAREMKSSLAGTQSLLVRSNRALRTETLAIFDRTFTITGALQLMTVFVAFVGVLSAMMSLQLDKQRQLGILKAIGLTARQLWGLVALETGLMGMVAGVFAIPTGFILALILIYIINRRSFGWTLQLELAVDPFIQALAVAIIAALLAGIYPTWRIIQRNTAEAIRFD
jgi:putative ABC transport system permease protein